MQIWQSMAARWGVVVRPSVWTMGAPVLVLACLIAPAATFAQNAYITNKQGNTVSVIDTSTNKVTSTITVGSNPYGVAVTPDGTKVYVTNEQGNTVSAINTATKMVTATITVGTLPYGVAVTPDGSKAYVANYNSATVSAINTKTNAVSTITVGSFPYGVAVTPDGKKVYVADIASGAVSVIDTTTNTVTFRVTDINFNAAVAFGVFIQPAKSFSKSFAGTPGQSNCNGKSVSALARQYGEINDAATTLGYSSVGALQDAIRTFCAG